MTTLDDIQARFERGDEALDAYGEGRGASSTAMVRMAGSIADVPKLVAALRAVEAVHHPVQFSATRFICGHCQYEPRTVIEWPCPTITAIREALG